MSKAVVVRLLADNSDLTRGLKQAEHEGTRFGRTMGGIKGGLKSFAVGAGVAAAAAGALAVKVGIDCVRAFHEAELVSAALDDALRRTGHAADGTREAFDKQAASLQHLTTFDDDAIASVQTIGTVFGLTRDQVLRTTPAVLDLATVMGTDVAGAAKILDLALAGNVKGLRALGIEGFKPTGDRAQDIITILGLLKPKIEGAAAAAASTSAGQWKQLTNALGNVKEQIGGVLAQSVLPAFLTGLLGTDVNAGNLADTLNNLGPKINEIGNTVANAAGQIGGLIKQVASAIGWLNRLGSGNTITGGTEGPNGEGPDVVGRWIERVVGKQIFMRNETKATTDVIADQGKVFGEGMDPAAVYGDALEMVGNDAKAAAPKLSEATRAAAALGEAMTSAFEGATGAAVAYDSIVIPVLEDSMAAWEAAVTTVEDAQARLIEAMKPPSADDLRGAELDVKDAILAVADARAQYAEVVAGAKVEVAAPISPSTFYETGKLPTMLGRVASSKEDIERASIALERAEIREREAGIRLQDVQRKGTGLDLDVIKAKGDVQTATDLLNDATVELHKAQAGITPELLLDALRKQEEGARQWAAALQVLSNQGIDKGILKELARLGPEGLPKVNAFISAMTAGYGGAINGLAATTRGALDAAIAVFPEVKPAMEAAAADLGASAGKVAGKVAGQQMALTLQESFVQQIGDQKFVIGPDGKFELAGRQAGRMPPLWHTPSPESVKALDGLARGGVTSGPALVGEGSVVHPEWVIPSDPKHRGRALDLFAGLSEALQVPQMARGGMVGGMRMGPQDLANLLDLPSLARGGLVRGSQAVQVAAYGGGATFNVVINIDGAGDPARVADEVRRELLKLGRRNGSVWAGYA